MQWLWGELRATQSGWQQKQHRGAYYGLHKVVQRLQNHEIVVDTRDSPLPLFAYAYTTKLDLPLLKLLAVVVCCLEESDVEQATTCGVS